MTVENGLAAVQQVHPAGVIDVAEAIRRAWSREHYAGPASREWRGDDGDASRTRLTIQGKQPYMQTAEAGDPAA